MAFTERGTNSLAPAFEGFRLDQPLTRITEAPLRHHNRVTLLRNGPETYEDWLAAIASARRWIHLENYIFRADKIGHTFADALIERARAGVSVRLLVDWFGSWDTPRRFWRDLRAGGVDLRFVTPVRLSDPFSAVHRDHRKVVVVDGLYGSAGGICIADEWLSRTPGTGLPYRDTAVRVTGPAVADLEEAFAGVWDRSGPSLPDDERPALESMALTGDQAARVIIQEPGKLRILRVLELLTASVEQRIWIADAYFLTVPRLTQALTAAAEGGVDVRLLLPATNDLPVVGALSRASYRPFLMAGVRIWEYSGLMMHAKTTLADHWWGRVGSTNLNVTGLWTNWEIDVVAEDERFASEMAAMFEEDLSNAREIRLEGASRRTRVRPDRSFGSYERRVQRDSPESGSRALAAVARAGVGAFNTDGVSLSGYERRSQAAIGGGLLTLAALAARWPKIVAWPLALTGGGFGAALLHRAIRLWRRPTQPELDLTGGEDEGGDPEAR